MYKIVLLSILSLIITFFIFLSTNFTSVAVFMLTYLTVGTIIIYMLTKHKKKSSEDLLTVFHVLFVFFMLYAFIAYMGYKEDNIFFMFPNEINYFSASNTLGKSENIAYIYRLCFVERIHIDSEGFYFFIGSIAYVANTFFDGNNVLLQIVNISFVAILINIFVYLFLKNNILNKNTLTFTLIFAFFSPVFYYSPWILRDLHIALFYSVGLVLATSRFTLTKLILFIPLIAITSEFRIEHGLFMIVLVLFFVFYKGRIHPNYKIIRFMLILFVIIASNLILTFFVPKFVNTLESMSAYSGYTIMRVEEQGIGKYLYRLPFGLKHISIAIFSQFTQFPPWTNLSNSKTSIQCLIGILSFIKSTFWSLLFLVSLFSIFYSKVRNKISTQLIILSLMFVLFLLVNVSNINDRRLIAMYPILFMYGCNLKLICNDYLFKNILTKSIVVYILMNVFYLILKITIL